MSKTQSREVRLGRLFVRLADSLVSEFDVVELLDELVANCVELLDATAAGLMLADQRGQLRVMAASSEDARLVEVFELQNQQGPCLDCYLSGEAIVALSASDQADRWPAFAPLLRDRGLGAVYAIPLRLRTETIGALNLFRLSNEPLPADELQIGQALADVATIAVLQQRAIEAGERLAVQLQTALNSRIAIEQAKGVIAQLAGTSMEGAFQQLRGYSRARRLPLSDVAAAVASGELDPASVIALQR